MLIYITLILSDYYFFSLPSPSFILLTVLSVYALLYFTVHFNLTEAANFIAIFFVGVAVTLFVVLVVFVSIWFYIRRRQPPKLSTGVLKVDTIEMQNETPPESSPNNQVCITSLRIKDRQRTRTVYFLLFCTWQFCIRNCVAL